KTFATQSPESGQTDRRIGTSALCQLRPNAAQQNSRLFDHLVDDGAQRLERRYKLQIGSSGARTSPSIVAADPYRLTQWGSRRMPTASNCLSHFLGNSIHRPRCA